ncbi:hypothetical protein F7R23_20650 [Burkholderia diffusa]|nr:hypothetical protein F7R23_20650 [Burkholderia diffusa]
MNPLRMPDAHSIHESGRIIRRAGATKNRWMRQIIIAKSAVRQIVAGQFHAAGRRARAGRTPPAPARMDVRTTTARQAISRASLPCTPAQARHRPRPAASNGWRRRSAAQRSDRSRR